MPPIIRAMPPTRRAPNTFDRIRATFHFWSARAHRHYGIVYGDRQEFEDAVDDYTRAISANPALRRAYLERGVLFWRELNHPRRAILDLSAALELTPGWGEALFCRGLAYGAAGDFAAAIHDLSDYLNSGETAWRADALSQLEVLRTLVGQPLPPGNAA